MKNILVIAPHADDEVLGCGGTIYKHYLAKDNVYVAIMTDASKGAPELFSDEEIDKIRNEALKAHKILGVTKTIFFDLPAPKLNQYPIYKIADKIRLLINKYRIDTIYIPHRGDLHKDHESVYDASLVAAKPLPTQSVKKIFVYETLSETDWGDTVSSNVFVPRFFNVIKKSVLNKKIAAMKCFKSQLKDPPNSRSLENLKNLASVRGSTVGNNYAESFDIVRILKK
tara:strand:+ start:19630 stop:20310 length:681 start_codon:yes stop_codon:yes gene_type:complete